MNSFKSLRPLFLLAAFFRLFFCLGPSSNMFFLPSLLMCRSVSQLTVRAWHAGQWVVTGYTVATYLQWIHRIINDLISTFPIVALLGGWAGRRPALHHHRCQREAINPEFKSTLLPQLVASCFCTHGDTLQENIKIQNIYVYVYVYVWCVLVWYEFIHRELSLSGIK